MLLSNLSFHVRLNKLALSVKQCHFNLTDGQKKKKKTITKRKKKKTITKKKRKENTKLEKRIKRREWEVDGWPPNQPPPPPPFLH